MAKASGRLCGDERMGSDLIQELRENSEVVIWLREASKLTAINYFQ